MEGVIRDSLEFIEGLARLLLETELNGVDPILDFAGELEVVRFVAEIEVLAPNLEVEAAVPIDFPGVIDDLPLSVEGAAIEVLAGIELFEVIELRGTDFRSLEMDFLTVEVEVVVVG